MVALSLFALAGAETVINVCVSGAWQHRHGMAGDGKRVDRVATFLSATATVLLLSAMLVQALYQRDEKRHVTHY